MKCTSANLLLEYPFSRCEIHIFSVYKADMMHLQKRGEKKRQSTLKNFLWSECERLKNKKLLFTALKYIFYFLGLITLP